VRLGYQGAAGISSHYCSTSPVILRLSLQRLLARYIPDLGPWGDRTLGTSLRSRDLHSLQRALAGYRGS